MFRKTISNVFGGLSQNNTNSQPFTQENETIELSTETTLTIQRNESAQNIFDLYDYEETQIFDEGVVENIISSNFTLEETNVKELLAYSSVSQSWRRASESNRFWKPICESFQQKHPHLKVDSKKSTPKEKYFSLLQSNTKKVILNPQDFYYVPIEQLIIKEDEFDSIVWSKDYNPVVESATLDKLVECLTSPSYFDLHFLNNFIMTFRSFTDCETLFDMLVERYNIPPPQNCSNEEFSQFKSEKLDKIRIRVTQTLKYWIQHFFVYDFDETMKEKVKEFIKNISSVKGGSAHGKILTGILEMVQHPSSSIEMKFEFPAIEKPKFQLFSNRNPTLFVWPSLEIARQITLINFKMFQRIEGKECLNQNWNYPNKAKNINEMIHHFNALSRWVSQNIVETENLKKRILLVEKFIDIADQLYNLNNFNGLFSVFSGLNSSSIYRLKVTWQGISESSKEIFKKLSEATATSPNFRPMRIRIVSVKPPCIPYIGLYLTDLTFIQDGCPKYLNGKINFIKCSQVSGNQKLNMFLDCNCD
jgi:hypothetical protein